MVMESGPTTREGLIEDVCAEGKRAEEDRRLYEKAVAMRLELVEAADGDRGAAGVHGETPYA